MEDNSLAIGWDDLLREMQAALVILQTDFLALALRPWGQFQVAVLFALFALAYVLDKRTEPGFEQWLRRVETTRSRLRMLAVLLRRLRLVYFVTLAWLAVLIMRMVTWPSRSYFISVVASIAGVWLAVSLIGRLVRNPLASKILTVSVWLVAALQILGLLPTAVSLLDSAGLSVGSFRLSLLMIVKAVAIVAVLVIVATLAARLAERRLERLDDLSPSMKVLVGKLVRVTLIAVVVAIGLQSMGFDLTTLTVFSGAIGLGIGFGLQKVVSNLISGIILLLDKSIKPGDVIEVGETFGWISKLSARFASVVTRDGREYLIPNEDLITNQVVNWSHSDLKVRLEVEFGVSYETDPMLVRRIAMEAAATPDRVLATPAPVCHLVGYGESSVDFVLRFWIADPRAGVVNIKSDVLIALWYALKANEVQIPYPMRDVQIRQPIDVTLHRPATSEARMR